jgi:diaminohydroxyphosphoribosylaminopyrimidine deaminase / 5-amino-6-(5-phosphoribosylamino)uracil reductase
VVIDVAAPDAAADARWMRRALEHARRGLGRTTPNPVVGCTIVTSDGIVVGDGAHERAGEAHAEVHALNEAGDAARGATLYCTLEPCSHTGKTGPCTERIIAAGVARVVAAMEDPFPLVSGRGFATLRAAGIDVDVGVEHDAAVRLNQPFLTVLRHKRPFVILKAAVSADGKIAAAPGVRTTLTSSAALRHAQFMRAQVDAIGVGSETVRVDDPLLTAREVHRDRPLTRVIFDRRLRTSRHARVFSTLSEGPVIIVTSHRAVSRHRELEFSQLGVTVANSRHDDFREMLEAVALHPIHSLILEGGAALHKAAWDASVVDYVQLYVAPVTLGAGGVDMGAGREFMAGGLFDRVEQQLGPDVLIEGYVHRPY